jgi:hypothetical protein
MIPSNQGPALDRHPPIPDTRQPDDSQITVTPFIKDLLSKWNITTIESPSNLLRLRDSMMGYLDVRPLDEEGIEAEKKIRWRRTASQVLEDEYVYEKRLCTDVVVTFIALAKAAGITNTRFVKIKNKTAHRIHSVAEIELSDGWYIFDVSNPDASPQKGEIREGEPYTVAGVPGEYYLWRKGRDSWDLGLNEYGDEKRMRGKSGRG